MQWAFGIRRKISAALLLAAIFVLILVTNMVDKRHVTQLGTSFSSVYEDRLIVESYIYRLSEHLFRKKIMIDSCLNPLAAGVIKPLLLGHHAAICQIIVDYEKTKLTQSESKYFNDLKGNINKLEALENDYVRNFQEGADPWQTRAGIDKEFDEASKTLGRLSAIQVFEGKMLNDHSKKIMAGSSLLTHFETGILIAIGLMIMVLVFESGSALSASARNQGLN
jgi:hypothetical protein